MWDKWENPCFGLVGSAVLDKSDRQVNCCFGLGGWENYSFKILTAFYFIIFFSLYFYRYSMYVYRQFLFLFWSFFTSWIRIFLWGSGSRRPPIMRICIRNTGRKKYRICPDHVWLVLKTIFLNLSGTKDQVAKGDKPRKAFQRAFQEYSSRMFVCKEILKHGGGAAW